MKTHNNQLLNVVNSTKNHLNFQIKATSIAMLLVLSSCGSDDGPTGPIVPPEPTTISLNQATITDGVPSIYAYDPGEQETIAIKAGNNQKLPSNINVDILNNNQMIRDNYKTITGGGTVVSTSINLADILEQNVDYSNITIRLEKGSNNQKDFTLQTLHLTAPQSTHNKEF